MRDFSAFFQRFGWPENKGRLPFCIGHRGASGHERENTLAAFRRAAELGAGLPGPLGVAAHGGAQPVVDGHLEALARVRRVRGIRGEDEVLAVIGERHEAQGAHGGDLQQGLRRRSGGAGRVQRYPRR